MMVIAGGSGHALEVFFELKRILSKNRMKDLICFDEDYSKLEFRQGIFVLHSKAELLKEVGNKFHFCLGVGNPAIRKKMFESLSSAGGNFFSLKSSRSTISDDVKGDFDAMANSFVGPNVHIGLGSLLNIGSNIHHECILGEFVEIGPGSLVLGNASIGDYSQIGAGVVVLPGVSIGKGCVIGAGSVVTRDIKEGSTAFGVPCKTKNP